MKNGITRKTTIRSRINNMESTQTVSGISAFSESGSITEKSNEQKYMTPIRSPITAVIARKIRKKRSISNMYFFRFRFSNLRELMPDFRSGMSSSNVPCRIKINSVPVKSSRTNTAAMPTARSGFDQMTELINFGI